MFAVRCSKLAEVVGLAEKVEAVNGRITMEDAGSYVS